MITAVGGSGDESERSGTSGEASAPALTEAFLGEIPAARMSSGSRAAKGTAREANVPTPVDKRDADRSPGTDGTSPRMRCHSRVKPQSYWPKIRAMLRGRGDGSRGLWVWSLSSCKTSSKDPQHEFLLSSLHDHGATKYRRQPRDREQGSAAFWNER